MADIEETVDLRAGDDGEIVEIEFARDGTLIDWAAESVSEVKFFAFSLADGSTYLDGVAAATAANGVLSYPVANGTALVADRYTAYYQVIAPGGKKESWPGTNNLILNVVK